MSSNNAPYATLKDAPKFEKRVGDVRAPWFKEPAAAKSLRIKDPLPYVPCNAKTAPYATLHNVVPKVTSEQSGGALPEQQPHPTNGSQSPKPQEKKSSTPYGTSNDVVKPRTKPNLVQVHQAPWDRSDRKLDTPKTQPNVSKIHPAPWNRSDGHQKVVQPNATKAPQAAPWERNDVHHKVLQSNVTKPPLAAPWERNDVHHKEGQSKVSKAQQQAAPWERNDVSYKPKLGRVELPAKPTPYATPFAPEVKQGKQETASVSS